METDYQSIVFSLLCMVLPLLLAPLLTGVINKTKAFFAGRKGVRLFQLYFDIWKLLKKERVHSASSNFLLRITPLSTLGLTVAAMVFLPPCFMDSPLGFSGDIILFFYLLGSARFLTVLAAMETGSSFEGMGASREVQFSALAEGTVFAILIFLVLRTDCLELSSILQRSGVRFDGIEGTAPLILVTFAFFIVLLCENCRVPFDDPETHLELTMIHEAMVLDYGGPDLAVIFYTASLKFYLFAAFFVSMLIPVDYAGSLMGVVFTLAGVFLTAILTGIVESSMARSRFLKLPQLLAGATVLVILGVFLQLYFSKGGLQ